MNHIKLYVVPGEKSFLAKHIKTYVISQASNVLDIDLVRNGAGETFKGRRLHKL